VNEPPDAAEADASACSLTERSAYSTHCNSSIAAFMSSTLTTSRSCANAAIIDVSHSVLTRRGMPPV
jgi:hypothetical protein